jgi:hypothetical protein
MKQQYLIKQKALTNDNTNADNNNFNQQTSNNNTQLNIISYYFSIRFLMENFFNYVTKPLSPEDVDVWFRSNNIIVEKIELYHDFTHSLYDLMMDTYFGHDNKNNETKITMSDDDNESHFKWCWGKVMSNFKKENIEFTEEGEHYDYFKSFFDEIFYQQKENMIRESVGDFFNELFDINKGFTKSDLDMITSIYRVLEKNIKR